MKKWLSVISILVLVIVLMDVAKIKRIIKITVASPAPHGDVLKKAKEQLKKKVMI